jgi:hypothetical protein
LLLRHPYLHNIEPKAIAVFDIADQTVIQTKAHSLRPVKPPPFKIQKNMRESLDNHVYVNVKKPFSQCDSPWRVFVATRQQAPSMTLIINSDHVHGSGEQR